MKFAVIGLGSFGFNLAKTLYEKGMEVIAIDKSEAKIDSVKELVTHAVHMDASLKENLEAVGVGDVDVVVVSLGDQVEASILTVLHLHEMGIKRIVAKAITEDHAKILDAVGATDIVYPEKDMAIKTALKLSTPNVLEFLSLTSGITIQEIAAPDKFVGKSLKQLNLTNRFGIQVIAVKEIIPDRTTFIPKADFVIKDSDILIIVGEEESLVKINQP
ncbi:MAG TPA: TrkA family potassium uptake protein [Candidatus Aminicenantes bacterium]|nr:TrkA family potassium uptake protein [Acidobacteriota bacterium]HOI44877.1 TrkA family potassium uptake protein [Candidatus Aminicenantes bacterium]